MIVHLTAEAEYDLEAIGDYIARDNPARAVSFLHELRAKCLGLADMPERFPLVPRYETAGVRRRVHGDYLIFYRVERDKVVIIHILHGTQNYSAILFPS
ncbi:plasmid stabilization system protein ParE [Sphingobium wenxiniae]|jgi:toxin ParE1/3/4|uniref:Plasmid stabilization system protein ParE n=1 Tax=Sphingobium wenxiniae (strain DSM 21828 / CGMCC 1.7748 / JZ-1) TaxID=595605 RepID=A0A562K8Q0_SPHWJ|nr:type II toxin-antitoxin system RelE/ParE family toxin [Sphingobium wenxiniae]MBB6193177.1 plasmid stabilization system protein ParE [Sphingobium wenxiniae]MBE5074931.1 type II toxin-antitoxin system RelE/ParE family toxin [Erythrobacteraceae bacterium E2-1 Yellow Sea]TWH91623.1 plasmid stabilization system protein ParE [Sphingobium wenxiniae]